MTGEFTTENEGDYYLSIKALKAWAGVDYIEVVPWQVVRVEAEISYSVSVDTGTRPIGRVGSTTFSEGYSVKIWDKGDEMKIEFFSYEGDYVIKPRVRSGSYSSTSSYANPTDYWPNGYSFKLDNQAVSFTGDISTISGRDASYGGSYWGTMNSGKIHISQGIHYLYIKANKEWAGVDYFDLVPAALTSSSVSSRVAAEENPLSTDATKYEVFPNPFRNALTISLPKPTSGNSQLSLTDPYGKIYFKQSRQLKGEATMELNLNDPQIKPGMYILKVKTQIGEKNYRLIKE
jgi:hypothetical protein